MIEQLKNDDPPYAFVRQIHEHCPLAASTYDFLWYHKDKDYKILLRKKNFKDDLHIHTNAFRNHIKMLCREALINIAENDETLFIELVSWRDVNER